MPDAALTPLSGADLRAGPARAPGIVGGWILAAAILALTLAPMAQVTLGTGLLYDNDDAMRMVQVRDFLAGQGWYDLVQHRVDPPAGLPMHWSRIIDLPTAAAMALLGHAFDPQTAERVATIVWPSILLAIFLAGLLFTASRLVSGMAVALGGIVIALNPVMLFQFVPGRIDHHGVQMVLTLLLAAATARAMDPAVPDRTRPASVAGAASAFMLAIGLETLPYVAAASIGFGSFWIWSGENFRRPAVAFGAVLSSLTFILYAATVDPSRWITPTCDTLSPPWIWVFAGGALTLVGLATFAGRRATRQGRLVLAVLTATLLVAVLALGWPTCLRGPYGAVDPVVEALWLSGVGEALPVVSLAAKDASTFLFFIAFPFFGALALAAAAIRERTHRSDFAILLLFSAIGFGISLMQMRGAPFAAAFALFGWLWMLDRALDPSAAGRRSPVVRTALAIAVLAAALPFGWGALGAALRESHAGKRSGCDFETNLAALAKEPAGLVLAPVRLGPRILLATPHSVLAAPYHRNNGGNRAALDTLSGSTEAAQSFVDGREIRYVAICNDDPDTRRLAAENPGALISDLLLGEAPAWLAPIAGDGPVRAWRVAR